MSKDKVNPTLPRTKKAKKLRLTAKNAILENPQSGRGGIQDRGRGDRVAMDNLVNPFIYGSDTVRAAQWAWVLYAGNWAAQKIIDIPVFDMFREGWRLKYLGSQPDVAKRLEAVQENLGVGEVFSKACRLERIFGGCVIVMGVKGVKGERPDSPLNPENIDIGDLVFLNHIGRNHVAKVEWDTDVNSLRYGRPRHYHVRDSIIHSSRLLVFDGNPISPYPGQDFMNSAASWDGFGLSVFSALWDPLMRSDGYQQSAAHLAANASIWIAIKRGLKDLKATRAGQGAVGEIERMVESMSMYKGYVLEGEDVDIKTLSANFGSVPELLMIGLQILSAASDIPATRFLGEAPGGLNSDGKSSLENYYNGIRARQRFYIQPQLKKLIPILLNSTFGPGVIHPDEIEIEWQPLWNMSDREKAEIRRLDIANVVNLEGLGIFTLKDALEELKTRRAVTISPEADLEAGRLEDKNRLKAQDFFPEV